jgi:hypothetical protein
MSNQRWQNTCFCVYKIHGAKLDLAEYIHILSGEEWLVNPTVYNLLARFFCWKFPLGICQ